MTTIECKEVCMSFGDQIVLDHISMRFENGHIYGITGRNGSGKTVLLKLICGLMTPTSGMILMNGKPVGASGTMHAEIGALIERPGFLGEYSGICLQSCGIKSAKWKLYKQCKQLGWIRRSKRGWHPIPWV